MSSLKRINAAAGTDFKRWSEVFSVVSAGGAKAVDATAKAGLKYRTLAEFDAAVARRHSDAKNLGYGTGRDPFPEVNHVAADANLPKFNYDLGLTKILPSGRKHKIPTVPGEVFEPLLKAYLARVAFLKRLMRQEARGVTVAQMCEIYGKRAPSILNSVVRRKMESLGIAMGGRPRGPMTYCLTRAETRRLAKACGWVERPESERRPYPRGGSGAGALLSAGISLD